MVYSSSMEVNSAIEVNVRFMLTQCDCGELADVKITKSNKNNNSGRIYYSCKRQRCNTFLGWCKISSIQQALNTIAVAEAFCTSYDFVVGEVKSNHQMVP